MRYPVALLASLALYVSGCEPPSYRCESAAQCVDGSAQGVCEPTGYCSFADPACDSERRYSELASAALAGACVPAGADIDPGSDSSCVLGISAGDTFTCAWKRDGTVWCWGAGASGQLGDGRSGADVFAPAPVQVVTATGAPLVDVERVGGGAAHACARAGDTLACWGSNSHGQLGFGVEVGVSRAHAELVLDDGGSVLVPAALPMTGFNHTCVVTRFHDVLCFGSNERAQLGRDTAKAPSSSPDDVPHPPGGAAFQFGDGGQRHSCAVVGDGTAWCWGANYDGQLGNNSAALDESAPPQQVATASGPLTKVAALSVGGGHTCATTSAGEVWCWGQGGSGQLGDGEAAQEQRAAIRVVTADGAPLTGATAVGLGRQHSCAVADGRVYCWGANQSGQVNSPAPNASTATLIAVTDDGAAFEGLSTVEGGNEHSCAWRASDGSVWCWGASSAGRLGTGDELARKGPVRVALSCP